MKNSITISIIANTFIWVGMLCGISFLEAPLKFQAPGITYYSIRIVCSK